MQRSAGHLPLLVLAGGLLAGGVLGLALPAARAGDEAPAAPATHVEGPHLAFEHDVIDLGQRGQEEEIQAHFKFWNDGTEKVTGIEAVGDCGCYGVAPSREELAPGEEATLDVDFRTLMMSGPVTKRIRVKTANAPRDFTILKLHVEVVAGVILEPGRIWFGDVLVGTTPKETVHVKWMDGVGKPFHVTSVEVPGHDQDFDITTEHYEQGKWKGTAVSFAFKKAPPLGMFSATALLRTDQPDYPRISLPVTANVTGKVWVQSRTVYFGWVPQGKSKSTSLLVKPFSHDVDLGEVTAESRGGHVQVKVEKNPMGRKGWWRVIVAVPKDAPPGKVDDVVEVHTAVPGEETTEIQVTGEVIVLADH